MQKIFIQLPSQTTPDPSGARPNSLSIRPKFAGQNGAENPGTGGLRGATNSGSGPYMELRIRPGAAFWELEIVNFFIFRLARNGENVL